MIIKNFVSFISISISLSFLLFSQTLCDLKISISFWKYHLIWASSIWKIIYIGWCAAWCFNVTLPGASHRRSSTPKPQIDASNYICRAAQLLSKLYATFSLRSISWTSLDPVATVLPRFIGFDVLSGSWQSMNFIPPLWTSWIESSSAINVGLLLSSF